MTEILQINGKLIMANNVLARGKKYQNFNKSWLRIGLAILGLYFLKVKFHFRVVVWQEKNPLFLNYKKHDLWI